MLTRIPRRPGPDQASCCSQADHAGLACENGVVVDETAHLGSVDLRHRRRRLEADSALRRPALAPGERAQRARAGPIGRLGDHRPPRPAAGGVVVLVLSLIHI